MRTSFLFFDLDRMFYVVAIRNYFKTVETPATNYMPLHSLLK